MSTACSGAARGQPLAEVNQLLCLAAQAYRALFLVVCAQGTKVTVPLGEGDPVTYEAAIDLSYLDPSRWLRAFFLGAVLRDDDLLAALMATPTDLIRQSTLKGPEFRYLFIDSLCVHRRPAERLGPTPGSGHAGHRSGAVGYPEPRLGADPGRPGHRPDV